MKKKTLFENKNRKFQIQRALQASMPNQKNRNVLQLDGRGVSRNEGIALSQLKRFEPFGAFAEACWIFELPISCR